MFVEWVFDRTRRGTKSTDMVCPGRRWRLHWHSGVSGQTSRNVGERFVRGSPQMPLFHRSVRLDAVIRALLRMSGAFWLAM